MNYNAYESNTTYGGGGGGGGFMADASQNSPSGQHNIHQETLRPVTIKQVIGAQQDADGTFKIDNNTVTHITLVGQIRNIALATTNTTYKIDDGTGSIEVKLWKDARDIVADDVSNTSLVEGAYCRAWGKPSRYHDKKYVSSNVIRPIKDNNEISYHLLHATSVHLYYTRGPLGGNEASNQGVVNGGQQQTGGTYSGVDLSGYNAVTKRVYQYLREAPQSNEGLHQQEIAAKLGIDTAEVARAGDDLLAGGAIYTTVDDQTWAVMEED